MEYPEHAKQAKVLVKAEIISEFLEWLSSQGLEICVIDGDDFCPDHLPIKKRLAQSFGIDLNLIEIEKRAMLNELRVMNNNA